MKEFKRFARIGIACLTVVFAIALFTGCPEESTSDSPPPKTTYTMTVADVTTAMSGSSQEVTIAPVITTKPKGKTVPAGTYTVSSNPASDLTVSQDGTKLTVPANLGPNDEGSAVYAVTLVYNMTGMVEVKATFNLTITRGVTEFGSVVVNNMNLPRLGAPETERAINFTVLDGNGIATTKFDSTVSLSVVNAGGLTFKSGTAGTIADPLIIESDGSLELGSTISVVIQAQQGGTDVGTQQTITVTVTAFMVNISFFRVVEGAAPALIAPSAGGYPASVEYGQTIQLPSELNHSVGATAFTFDDVEFRSVSNSGTAWDFENDKVNGPVSLYANFKSSAAYYTAQIVISLANVPAAAVAGTETVVIREIAQSDGGWIHHQADLNPSDQKFRVEISDILRSKPFKFVVLVVEAGDDPELKSFRSQDTENVFNYGTLTTATATINYTVTQWVRPFTESGELLQYFMMQGTTSWSVFDIAATVGSANEGEKPWRLENFRITDMYFTGDGPSSGLGGGCGPRAPNSMYFRMWHRDGTADNILDTNGGTGILTQRVPLTGVDQQEAAYELEDGDDVTLYAWINLYNDSVSAVELLIGDQSLSLPVARMPLGTLWVQAFFTATLTSADIANDYVEVGMSITKKSTNPTTAGGGCRFGIDRFSFTKGATAPYQGLPSVFRVTVPTVELESDETKPVLPNVTEDGTTPAQTYTVDFTCTTCADCEITISGDVDNGFEATSPDNVADRNHIYRADVKVGSLVVASTTFAIITGDPYYTLTANITVPAALLDTNDVPWIVGGAGSGFGSVVLTQVGSTDVWTADIPKIPLANTSVAYNIYLGTASAADKYIKAQRNNFVFVKLGNAKTATTSRTISSWFGTLDDQSNTLLADSSFEDTSSGWYLGSAGWILGGEMRFPSTNVWKQNNPGGAGRTSGRWYEGWGWTDWADPDDPNPDDPFDWTKAEWGFLPDGKTGTLYQEVDAATASLAAGDSVKLSVWVKRVNANQSAFKLLVGSKKVDVFSLLDNSEDWQYVSAVVTLSAADIDGNGNIVVGVEYTSTRDCKISLDEFYFAKN